MSCSEFNATPSGSQVVIALGRGGYGSAAQAELNALCEHLRQLLPHTHVASAYVDRASPSLPEALDACLLACPEAVQITVQPMFMPVDNALLRWLEKVVQRWRHRQANPAALPRIVFARPLGQLDELPAILARSLAHMQQCPSVWPDVCQTQPDNWQNDPKAWSQAPPIEHHVLFCMGPRCTALGAVGLWSHLRERLNSNPQLNKTTMALHTSCQYPCNRGPLMIVYPEGTWWGHLDEAAIERIVDAQLKPGEDMQAHLVHRTGDASVG